MQDFYEITFESYYSELRITADAVLDWWDQTVRSLATQEGGRALRVFQMCWPAGPASHPSIVRIYRKYYLKIWEINENIAISIDDQDKEKIDEELLWGDQRMGGIVSIYPPDQVLIDWLEDRDKELHNVMKKLVFIPVGMEVYND